MEQKMRIRPTWDEYFMALSEMVASRSTCERAHVGSVIMREKRVLSTGYNGSPAGMPHCDDSGHEMVEGHCVRTIHAEMNAIIQAAKNGVNINGSELYSTHFPCYNCFKHITNAGIKAIHYREGYRIEPKILEMAKKLGIVIRQIEISKDKIQSFRNN